MNVLIFGATGSAGGSVLRASLSDPDMHEVRAMGRRAPDLENRRLRVILRTDFERHDPGGDAFRGLDACFFCLGVSATQVREEAEYRRITVGFASAAARAVREGSPGAAFHFLSGMGTRADSRYMWARVKAEAEVEVGRIAEAVCWRPGFVDGEASDTGAWYHGMLRPGFRLLRPFRGLYVSGSDLGRAFLQATREGMRSRIVENREIRSIANRWSAVPAQAEGRAESPPEGDGGSARP